jgi:F0F1-type ATP synthase membrane subunit b/b'
MKVHEELAGLHRTYEHKVNYYKAKVKNLTTERNAEIAKANADAQNDAEKQNNDLQVAYETAMKKVHESINTAKAEFEKERQAKIKSAAVLRIDIDPRFQEVIDTFLEQLPKQE